MHAVFHLCVRGRGVGSGEGGLEGGTARGRAGWER